MNGYSSAEVPGSGAFGSGAFGSGASGSGASGSGAFGSGVPASGVPAPPDGPGVAPPFSAPPTDRNKRGLWVGLGVGALVMVLCCAGGIFGFVLLTVHGTRQIEQDAKLVVQDYLAALQDREYDSAYDLLCPALTRNMSAETFAARESDRPEITSYVVGTAQVGNAVVVPADVNYATGGTDNKRYVLSQEFGADLL